MFICAHPWRLEKTQSSQDYCYPRSEILPTVRENCCQGRGEIDWEGQSSDVIDGVEQKPHSRHSLQLFAANEEYRKHR